MENLNEQPSPTNEPSIHEFFRQLLADRDARIAQLTGDIDLLKNQPTSQPTLSPADNAAEMAALLGGLRSENEQLRSRFSKEKADFIQQLARQDDELKKLREENLAFRNASPVDKSTGGGFGWIGWFLFAGLVGLAAFFWAKFKYRQVAPTQAIFEKYRDQRLFQFEYDINQGQFGKVEAALDKDLTDKNYAAIQPQIDFLRKTIRASGRFLADHGTGAKAENYVALTEKPGIQPAESPEKPGKTKTLTINYDTPVTLRHEATTTSDALKKLPTGTVLTVLDRTFTRDKVHTMIDGNKWELRDYWYKVETSGGETGWVFGFFTSKSQQIKYILDSAGEPVIPEKAAELPSATVPVSEN